MKASTTKVIAIVAVIIALGAGFGIGYMVNGSMNDETQNTAMQSGTNIGDTVAEADLRVTLNNLLREHVTSSLTVTRNIVDGAPQEKIDGSKAAQTANAVAIATAVGDIYGQEAQDAITPPFVEHIAQSNNYAQAVADGDTMAQDAALMLLRAELRKVADIFNSVIPSVSSDDLYAALSAHEDLLNDAAVAYNNGDYEQAYKLENDALVQISGGAEVLSTGIVAAKPELFE